jgi:hypothetical protein
MKENNVCGRKHEHTYMNRKQKYEEVTQGRRTYIYASQTHGMCREYKSSEHTYMNRKKRYEELT